MYSTKQRSINLSTTPLQNEVNTVIWLPRSPECDLTSSKVVSSFERNVQLEQTSQCTLPYQWKEVEQFSQSCNTTHKCSVSMGLLQHVIVAPAWHTYALTLAVERNAWDVKTEISKWYTEFKVIGQITWYIFEIMIGLRIITVTSLYQDGDSPRGIRHLFGNQKIKLRYFCNKNHWRLRLFLSSVRSCTISSWD